MSALAKGENGWRVSELRMPLLLTRSWKKSGRVLSGVKCEQNREFVHEDMFERQTLTMCDQRVHKPTNNSRADSLAWMALGLVTQKQMCPDAERDAEGLGSKLQRETPAFFLLG